MADALIHRMGKNINPGVLTLSLYTVTIYGGTGANTITYEYNGNGAVSASSSNTGVATVAVSGSNIVVTYVAPGSAIITVSAPKTNKFTECSAILSVTCNKTVLTKPSLATTSYTNTDATTRTPGYNNYNSNLMTVSGTTSANSPGSYTIYFNLRDTNRYCWSDGSTGQIGCGWSIVGGSVWFRVKPTNSDTYLEFTVTYAPWGSLNERYNYSWTSEGGSYISFNFWPRIAKVSSWSSEYQCQRGQNVDLKGHAGPINGETYYGYGGFSNM